MSKIQTIICLIVFLIILFSMDMIFDNPLRETFRGKKVGPVISGQEVGSELDYIPSVKQNINRGFLAAKPPSNYIVHSDDEPLHFSFPF